MEENIALFDVCTVVFHDHRPEVFLCACGARDFDPMARTAAEGVILTFRVSPADARLELVHKTATDEVPQTLRAFQGRLLAGCGSVLRLYDLGRRQLLRKCENKLAFASPIVSLHCQGDRIVVGEALGSFTFCHYRKEENVFAVVADDPVPRVLTCSAQLDYDTVIGADKFGNVFVEQMPPCVGEDVEDDPTGGALLGLEKGFLNGARSKLDLKCNFYLGDVVTSLSRTSFVPGGDELVIYTTVSGAIGCLVPIRTKTDAEFFQLFEMQMRNAITPLTGRDHFAYRSYYTCVKVFILFFFFSFSFFTYFDFFPFLMNDRMCMTVIYANNTRSCHQKPRGKSQRNSIARRTKSSRNWKASVRFNRAKKMPFKPIFTLI